MKHTLLIITLGLVMTSCDSVDQPAINDESSETTYAYAASESDQDALNAKPTPECWTDLNDLISKVPVLPASVERSDERGNAFIIVKDGGGNPLYGVASPGHLIGKGHTFACRPNFVGFSGETWGKRGGGKKRYALTKAIFEESLEHYDL
jgi:hypothetical protein